MLAVRIAAAIGRPVRAQLRRSSHGFQTGSDRATRAGGPAFVPAVNRRLVGTGAVLLVDDVVTTGATMRAAARALRSIGATTVVGAGAARTP